MSEFGEALGTAVEGGLFARAVSGQAGHDAKPSGDGHFHENTCLNCGTALIGSHCHECGQPAHLHRTLGALGHDLAHGVLHLDGKTWRTLPMLAWKPGELTRRYVHGERARFVSPMALFLFSIFLMFAVFEAIGITPPTEITTSEGFKQSLTELRKDSAEERDTLRAKVAAMTPDDAGRAKAEKDLADLDKTIAGFDTARGAIGNTKDTVTVETFKTGIPFIDHGIQKWNTNPGLMLYKLQSNSYKFSWLMIPLSLPFMWLLFFWKRGVKVYDHAIFVTYSIAFMTLLFVVASLLATWGVSAAIVAPLTTVLPAWHLYRQLRGAYGLSRFSALWRLVVLSGMIVIVLSLFVQILLLMGAF